MLPLGAVPSRAMVGRWVQAAAAQAGRLLVVLDLACQARVRVLCLDEIFLHRAPVLMAIEPHSMAWMAGQRGPDRSGESWREVITHWPCLEHVIADGGQGLERGVKLAHAARGAQGEAAETVSSQAMTMGLDVFHTQRELERVIQRQWKQAERQLDTASQADAKVERYQRQGRDPRRNRSLSSVAHSRRSAAPRRRPTDARPRLGHRPCSTLWRTQCPCDCLCNASTAAPRS